MVLAALAIRAWAALHGSRPLEKQFGPTATIDTDLILMMVDPKWELELEERRLDLAGWQCWFLAQSFLSSGFDCVIIGGNGWHTPDEGLNDMIGFLLPVADVFHVTLDPDLDEVQRRVAARGGDHSADWLAEHVAWMRARYGLSDTDIDLARSTSGWSAGSERRGSGPSRPTSCGTRS